MKNNYLVLAGNNEKEKVPGVNFLFPLKGFCVGVAKEYTLKDIEENSYIYINRILDCEAINDFTELLPTIEKKLKGIVFEDLGILDLLKKSKSKLEKILFPTHAVCSSYTANAYLKEVDTVILSPDITQEEIRIISEKTIKPISIYLYGNLPYMYSRRKLLTNYQKEFQLEKQTQTIVTEPIKNQSFLIVENEFGTVLYDPKPLDARCLLDLKNSKYFFLNLEFTTITNMKEWLFQFENNNPLENTTEGFLNQETIYRLPPRSV